MTLKVDFSNTKINPPGYDGPIKCPSCAGSAYKISGPIPTKTDSYEDGYVCYLNIFCFDCHYYEVQNGDARDEYLKRMDRK